MIFKLVNKDLFTSASGKKVENSESSVEFEGNRVLPESVDRMMGALTAGTSGSAAAILGTSSAALFIGSIFTNSLSFLSKLIQIIEFTGLMELFNVKFDQMMGQFLSQINEATEFNFVGFFTNKVTDTVENSIASQWKGKLSEKEVKPYLLQDLGYPGLAMMVRLPHRNNSNFCRLFIF